MVGIANFRSHLPDQMIRAPRILNVKKSDIVWSGDTLICCNQLQHSPAFRRKGTTIPPKPKKRRSGEAEKEGFTPGTSKTGPTYGKLNLSSRGRETLVVLSLLCLSLSLRLYHFKVGEKIEVLCQDSGIRGCWFGCKVLQASQKRLKVHYKDVEDVEESGGYIEEWVPKFRIAAPDKLEMRCPSRFTIRPWPPEDSSDFSFEVGAPVDAWWGNGWWEGVVVGTNIFGSDNLRVYLPGENRFLNLQRKNVRTSRDWVINKWVRVKAKPDIFSIISSNVSPQTKLPSCTSTKLQPVKEEKHGLLLSMKTENLETVESFKCKKRHLGNEDDN